MFQSGKSGTVRFTVQQTEMDKVDSNGYKNRLARLEQQLFAPVPSPNVTESFYYDYPYYFYCYFRACFFFCLVPFWVDFTDKANIKLVTYKFQSIICAIVHVTSFVLAILEFRLEVAQPIKDHPEKIFDMANNLFSAIYVFYFAKAVRSNDILKVLEPPPGNITRKVI